MDLVTEHVGTDVAVVHVHDRLTMSGAGELKALVDRAVADGRTLVVVDLGPTTFLDSSGLGALVGGMRAARAAGGDLRLAGVGAQVRTVLELTTMDRVLRPYDTVEDAVGDRR